VQRFDLTSFYSHGLTIALMIVLAYVFNSYPEIDNNFSLLFYDPQFGFYLQDNAVIKIIHSSVPAICAIFILVAGIYSLSILRKKRSIHPKYYMKIIFVTLVCLLGPGVLVHNGIKDNFNRARPENTTYFGGDKLFTPAFSVSDQCSHSCSFVSGHSSVGFMFIAFAFLLRGLKRRLMVLISLFLGLTIGLGRVMEGDHYLSDIIFAGFAVYITAFYLFRIIRPIEK